MLASSMRLSFVTQKHDVLLLLLLYDITREYDKYVQMLISYACSSIDRRVIELKEFI